MKKNGNNPAADRKLAIALTRLVTKKEFRETVAGLVTKTEFRETVAGLVTKTEFNRAMEKIDDRFQGIDDRFQGIDDRFQGVDDRFQGIDKAFRIINERFNFIDEEIAEIKKNMYTKQDHARDMVWMDKAMAEIEAAREERILSGRQMLRIDDKVFDHEKRISALESK